MKEEDYNHSCEHCSTYRSICYGCLVKERDNLKRRVEQLAKLDTSSFTRPVLKKVMALCDKHEDGKFSLPSGCPICLNLSLSHALAAIDYLCEEPNQYRVSNYDVTYDEKAVLAHVGKRLLEQRNELTMNGFQHLADRTASHSPHLFLQVDGEYKEVPFLYSAFGMGGECGEAQSKIKKIIRDHKGELDDAARDAISLELGDILWYLSQVALNCDLTLERVARDNVAKLEARNKAGKIKGDGDNR